MNVDFRFLPWILLPFNTGGKDMEVYTRYKLGVSIPLLVKSKSNKIIFNLAYEIFLHHTADTMSDENGFAKDEEMFQRTILYTNLSLVTAPVVYTLGYWMENSTNMKGADLDMTNHHVYIAANFNMDFTSKAK